MPSEALSAAGIDKEATFRYKKSPRLTRPPRTLCVGLMTGIVRL
ncbi:hypothetical protein SAMN04487914_13821 [Arthrobacter sp. ok909]|nr:hypothetical protein SAMN04487914_13821 [Arthrobacter sp. ok909]